MYPHGKQIHFAFVDASRLANTRSPLRVASMAVIVRMKVNTFSHYFHDHHGAGDEKKRVA